MEHAIRLVASTILSLEQSDDIPLRARLVLPFSSRSADLGIWANCFLFAESKKRVLDSSDRREYFK
jgi:hypothetical protein